MKLRKAVIPAAGLGTRFFPATKAVPKELLPIVNRPALEYIVEELADSGIEEVILIVHPDKQSIVHHFTQGGTVEEALKKREQSARAAPLNALLDRVTFLTVYQREPLGLGHAVLCAKKAVGDEPFAVVLPDDLVRSKKPCLRQLIGVYEKEGLPVVALEQVPKDQVNLYGMVGGASKGRKPFRIETIVEKPPVKKAPSRWAVIGRYVLTPAVFEEIEKTKPGASGEIQLTDALARLAADSGLIGVPFEGERFDIGRAHGYLHANLAYGLDNPEIARVLRPAVKRLLHRR